VSVVDGVKRRVRRVAGLARWAASGAPTSLPTAPGARTEDGVRVLYLHHSTGERIWRGGIPDLVAERGTPGAPPIGIVEWTYPHAPYPWRNDPADYWDLWVKHRGPRGWQGQASLEMLASAWDVIVVKHCFTASAMVAPGSGRGAGSGRTLANYQAQMTDLAAVMREFPATTFLLWTPPPLVAAATTAAAIEQAEAYAQWLRDTWQRPGDQLFLWDFRAIAAADGVLKAEYAAGPRDSHPNAVLAQLAAPLFVQRLIDVVEGRGHSGALTGDPARG
jgi:hypothetical protein